MISFQDETEAQAAPDVPKAQPYVSFVIPPPASAADTSRFNVQLDDGRVFTVDMPEGCSVGDTVHAIIVEDEDSSGSSLLLIPPDRLKATATLPQADAVPGDGVIFEEIGEEAANSVPARYTLGNKTIAAMTAGGIIGTLVAGPIVGAVVVGVVLSGATAPYTQTYADFKQTPLGIKTTAATNAASAKLKAIDEKLGVSETVHSTKVAIVSKAKEVDSKYEISEKTVSLKTSIEDKVNNSTAALTEKLREGDEKYKVTEKMNTAVKTVEERVNKAGEGIQTASAAVALKAGLMWRQAAQKLRARTQGGDSEADEGGSAAPAPANDTDHGLDHNDHDGSSNNFRL